MIALLACIGAPEDTADSGPVEDSVPIEDTGDTGDTGVVDTCEPEPSKGELWGVASAWNGEGPGLDGSVADLGVRAGAVVWRLDLDTMHGEIVRLFDPVVDDIWYLGTLALHPTQNRAYVSGYHYGPHASYDSDDWLDGVDVIIELDTDTYQVLQVWDMDPDPYSFTGYATDFVDGQAGLYSPGDLQFLGTQLVAVEGGTVEHSDLVHLDPSTQTLTELGPVVADGVWVAELEEQSDGRVYAMCEPQPAPNLAPDGTELPFLPEPVRFAELDPALVNTCENVRFTFALDRVHGLATTDEDQLYAARTTSTYWYDLVDPEVADLQLYQVDTAGGMTAVHDFTALFSTVPAPLNGLGGMDWRPRP